MVQEPSRVVLATQLTMQLMGRKALLAGGRQMERGGPLDKLGVATLHDRAGHNGEVLAARRGTAAVSAKLLGRVMRLASALGANRPIRPADGFKPLPGGFFIVKDRVCEIVLVHRGLSNGLFTSISHLWCQLRICDYFPIVTEYNLTRIN